MTDEPQFHCQTTTWSHDDLVTAMASHQPFGDAGANGPNVTHNGSTANGGSKNTQPKTYPRTCFKYKNRTSPLSKTICIKMANVRDAVQIAHARAFASATQTPPRRALSTADQAAIYEAVHMDPPTAVQRSALGKRFGPVIAPPAAPAPPASPKLAAAGLGKELELEGWTLSADGPPAPSIVVTEHQ